MDETFRLSTSTIPFSIFTFGLSLVLAPHWSRLGEYDGKVKTQSRQQANRKTLAKSNTEPTYEGQLSAIYRSLDKQNGEVRLLWLGNASRLHCPALESQHISIAMTTASLNDRNLEYDALSYAWGDPNCTRQIKVNGKRHLVPENLFTALCNLSRPGSLGRAIWIDAICINQEDMSERNHQVSLMRELYARAKVVHIFLGNETANTAAMFESARKIAAGTSVQILIAANRLGNAHLHDLFICPWWTRLWVLQEAALAQHPVVRWGGETIPFWELMTAMAAAKIAKLNGDFDPPSKSHSDNHERWVYNFDRAVYSFTVLKERSIPPELVLNVSSNLEATEESDRIYGVLALMPSLEHITADYSLSASTIHKRTTVDVMKSQRSLRVLRLIRRSNDSPTNRRPSWVPAFSGIGGLIGLHKEDFGLKGNDVFIPFLLEEAGAKGIRVNTLIVDKISIIGPHCRRGDRHHVGSSLKSRDAEEHLRRTLRNWLRIVSMSAEENHVCSNFDERHISEHRSSCSRVVFWKTILCDGLFGLVTGREDQDLDTTMEEYDSWLEGRQLNNTLSTYQYQQLHCWPGHQPSSRPKPVEWVFHDPTCRRTMRSHFLEVKRFRTFCGLV